MLTILVVDCWNVHGVGCKTKIGTVFPNVPNIGKSEGMIHTLADTIKLNAGVKKN